MNPRHILFAMTLGVACVCFSRPAPKNVSLNSIRGRLDSLQTKPTNFLYSSDSAAWESVMDSIATGDSAWLDVAWRLRANADGWPGEELDMSIAFALPHNPIGVLKLIQRGFPLDKACGSPLFEAPPDSDRALLRAMRKALSKRLEPGLETLRHACLDSVNAELKRL